MRSMLLLLFMQTVPCFMFMAQPGDRVFSFFLKGVPEALWNEGIVSKAYKERINLDGE